MKYPIFKRYDKNVDPVDGETFTDHMVQVPSGVPSLYYLSPWIWSVTATKKSICKNNMCKPGKFAKLLWKQNKMFVETWQVCNFKYF